MKNTATKILILFVFCLFGQSLPAYAASAPASEYVKVEKRKKQQLSKKARKKRLRKLRKQYKTELKGMTKAEKNAFLEDRIEEEQFIPNPWFSLGIALLLIGGVLAIIFGGWIGWIGGGIALVGFACLVVWIIGDMDRVY